MFDMERIIQTYLDNPCSGRAHLDVPVHRYDRRSPDSPVSCVPDNLSQSTRRGITLVARLNALHENIRREKKRMADKMGRKGCFARLRSSAVTNFGSAAIGDAPKEIKT